MNEVVEDLKKGENLRAVVQKRNGRMAKLVRELIKDSNNSETKRRWVPKFTSGGSSMMDIMDGGLHQTARKRICDRVGAEYFHDSELAKLWTALLKNSNRGPKGISTAWWVKNVEFPLRKIGYLLDEFHMDFYHYQKTKMELGPRFEHLLTTKLFFALKAASEPMAKKMNRIRSLLVFRYVCEKNYSKLLQMALYKNDATGTGYLTEGGLRSFLLGYEPFQKQFSLASPILNEHYVTVAVKRFFFFLDPQRKGKIRIVDILASGLIDEIHFPGEDEQCAPGSDEVDWFSLKTANRIYHHFELLDKEFKSTLSETDFLKFGLDLRKNKTIKDDDTVAPATQLTPTFVHKLFESVATNGGRMDFTTFTEFVLAITYVHEQQAISYFIRIFDRNGKGYLDAFDFHIFYRDIQKRCGCDSVAFSDIRNDIFDTIKPPIPDHITAKDIAKCGKAGGHIIKMLISMKGFENFESLDLSEFDLVPEPKPLTAPAKTENIERLATIRFPEEGNETEKTHFKMIKGAKKGICKSSKRVRDESTEDEEEIHENKQYAD